MKKRKLANGDADDDDDDDDGRNSHLDGPDAVASDLCPDSSSDELVEWVSVHQILHRDVTYHQLQLPDDIWALIMESLPYQDVMQVAVVSKHMLQRVMPKVTRINVFHAEELHARQARRMPNVVFCYLNCLLKPSSPDTELPAPAAAAGQQIRVEYNSEAADRIVPFLSRFRKLRMAFCGAIIHEGDGGGQNNTWVVWKGDTNIAKKLKRLLYDPRTTTNDRNGQLHRGLVKAICGAMAAGALSKHLSLNGLTHPKLTLCPKLDMIFARQQHMTTACSFCEAMVKHLPVNALLQMTNHALCCVPVEERFAEILKRGAAGHLKKPARFEFVVKHCFKAFSVRPNVKMVAVMKHSIDELRALAAAGLDTKSVDLTIFYRELLSLKGNAESLSFSQQAFDQIRSAGYMLNSQELSKQGVNLQDFTNHNDDERPGRIHHLFAQALDRAGGAQPVHAFQHQVRINPHGDGAEINQVFDEIRNQFQQLRQRLAQHPNLMMRPVEGGEEEEELPAEIVE